MTVTGNCDRKKLLQILEGALFQDCFQDKFPSTLFFFFSRLITLWKGGSSQIVACKLKTATVLWFAFVSCNTFYCHICMCIHVYLYVYICVFMCMYSQDTNFVFNVEVFLYREMLWNYLLIWWTVCKKQIFFLLPSFFLCLGTGLDVRYFIVA